jgi:hypothetical protein
MPDPTGQIRSGSRILALNKATLARPYIARLSVFSLLIWPSTWPLLQGSAIAFRTVAMSFLNVIAN